MKVYLDSGVFIDYLIGRGHTGSFLRATERRGRVPERLLEDAEACLSAIVQRHEGITSSLTCYEVEEAMYRELRRTTNDVPNVDRFIIPAARAVITQTLVTIELFKIALLDLTSAVVIAQCDNVELQSAGFALPTRCTSPRHSLTEPNYSSRQMAPCLRSAMPS